MGDVLFTLPAVHAVRAAFPGAQLTYLVSNRCAPLLEGFAGITQTAVFDRGAFRQLSFGAWWRNTFGLAAQLRRARIDLVIDFHGFGETALLGWLSGASRRWGSLEGKKLRRLAYTQVVPLCHDCHPVDQNLRFLRGCGLDPATVRNDFHLPERYLEAARALYARLGLSWERPTVFIQPFTSDPQKNLPLEKLIAFAGHCRRRGVQVLFGGGPHDRALLLPVLPKEFPTSAGTELLVTAGLMQLSSLVVGGDTGPVHLAVALGKRVVMLVSLLGPQTPLPYGKPEWALPAPSGRPVSEIPVEQLMAAADLALAPRGALTSV